MGLFSWFFSEKCSTCGSKIRPGVFYCPQCGQPTPGAGIVCMGCGTRLKPTAQFCGHCGTSVYRITEDSGPVDALNRWKREASQFARRIEAGDLNALLQRGLVVEPGTRALIFQGGKLAGVVGEGKYNLDRPMEGVATAVPATAIVMDAGDTQLSLLFPEVLTQEDVRADVIVEVVVRLADPVVFYTNLMHGREAVPVAVITELMWTAGANVVESCVRQTRVRDLKANLELKNRLETGLRTNLLNMLENNGLTLIELRFVDFSSPVYDKLRERRAETAIFEEKVADTERRAVLNRRLREALTKDRMDRFTSGKDLEDFIRQTEHELGMKEVVRQAEMEGIVRSYEEKKEDAEIARRHLLEKLELEHTLALIRQQHVIDDEHLQHRVRHEREALEARQEAEWKAFVQTRKVKDAQREDQLKDVRARAEEVKMKIGLAGEAIDLRRKKAAQEHEAESLRVQREQEEKDREARRRQAELDQLARHQVERIRALSEAEQSRLAVDLKKTEILKDMSEQQILALAAKDSPHVAAAIAERAKAQAQAGASAEVKALYEKLLTGKEAEADRMERVMSRAMESVERVAGGAAGRERQEKEEIKSVMNQDMDRISDVAAGKSRMPTGSTPQTPNIVCPKCHRQSPAGVKFCDNCGHPFFE